MTKKERAAKIQEVFDVVYKDAECSLDYRTPHELLVAVQLSAQCTDARVNIVTKDLFKRYKSVYEFAGADEDELAAIIRPCGFYKNKAKRHRQPFRRRNSLHNGGTHFACGSRQKDGKSYLGRRFLTAGNRRGYALHKTYKPLRIGKGERPGKNRVCPQKDIKSQNEQPLLPPACSPRQSGLPCKKSELRRVPRK